MSLTRIAATAAFVVAFLASSASTAAAADEAEPAPPSVTWSVQPGDARAVDGRSWVEAELDPGETLTEYLHLTNHGDVEATFRLSAADGYFTENGRFNMLPSDQPSVDAGRWIQLPGTVALDPGESATVPFILTVPENATPGDHPAGVAASVDTTGGGQVSVESRVGFRVMTRVTGEISPAVRAAVIAEHHGSLNPFEPGVLTASYSVHNTGNARLQAVPVLRVAGPFGLFSREVAGTPLDEIAPGESRRGVTRIAAVWPAFFYTVEADVHTGQPAEGPAVGAAQVTRGTTSVLALPWSQLVLILFATVLMTGYLVGRRRKRRSVEHLIRTAREEGRREGSRNRMTPGAASVAILALAGCGLLQPSLPAIADTGDDSGVTVQVDIEPLRPSGGPDAAPPAHTPRTHDRADLADTGPSAILPVSVIAAGLLVGTGVVLTIHSRFRSRAATAARWPGGG